MIFTDHIQPPTEMFDLMGSQFVLQLLIDIHDGIFGTFRISKIFKAYPIDEFHIPEKELPQRILVTGMAKTLKQNGIRNGTGFQIRGVWVRVAVLSVAVLSLAAL